MAAMTEHSASPGVGLAGHRTLRFFFALAAGVLVALAARGLQPAPAARAETPTTGITEVAEYIHKGDYFVERRTWYSGDAATPNTGGATGDGVVTAQYRLNPHSWTTPSIPVPVYYNPANQGSNPDASGLIEDAIGKWDAVTTAFSFSWEGATDAGAGACDDSISADGLNTITFSTQLTQGTLGRTCTLFRAPNAPLEEFDMEVNVNGPWSAATPTPAGRYDLASTILHELGHAAGIGHPCESGACSPAERASVMYPTLKDGTQKRSLTPDDVAALLALYPGGTAYPQIPEIPDFKRSFHARMMAIARD
jgi:hypothetical protein